jgi:hypothetical protein
VLVLGEHISLDIESGASKLSLPTALTANIRQCWEGLTGTNTVAYSSRVSELNKRSFINNNIIKRMYE